MRKQQGTSTNNENSTPQPKRIPQPSGGGRGHYELSVSRRTLIRWKQGLCDPTWQGLVVPKPLVPPTKVTDDVLRQIIRLRSRTDWGRVLLKARLPYELSLSTYCRIIKERGFSRGSKIKNVRFHCHKPTTMGKVERFHQTVTQELPYCNGDYELFRYRYNHIRPHMSLHYKTPAEVYFDLQQRLKMTGPKPAQKLGG